MKLRMDKREECAVTKYLQKKRITCKGIQVDMVQIHIAEEISSNASVKMCEMEF